MSEDHKYSRRQIIDFVHGDISLEYATQLLTDSAFNDELDADLWINERLASIEYPSFDAFFDCMNHNEDESKPSV